MSEVVVVGAGVFGVWTAHALQAAGARVTVVDAYGPANSRASSGDASRILRCGYGADAIYSRWAGESLAEWRALSERHGGQLFHECGVLWLASGDDAYSRATHDTLQQVHLPVERLDRATLAARYPHIAADDVQVALLEPRSGVMLASRAVQALARALEQSGARFVHGAVVPPADGRRLTSVRLSSGVAIEGDTFVFACGPWLPRVFPDVLTGRIRPTRQVVVYFGAPAGDDRFGPAATPAWVDFAAGIYGIPDLEHRGLKVGIDRHGPPFDPDRGDRVVDEGSIEAARAWLRHRMPAMADAPVTEARVCQYENTDTGDFLIDRHPEIENAWIAGGGSGHGFKHGPAIGRYVAGLLCNAVEPDPRFTLAARGRTPHRAVY